MSYFSQPYNFISLGLFGIFLIPLIVWTLIWKGLALWKAARTGSKGWFIALLAINTVGILEILYLYVFSEKDNSSTSTNGVAPTTAK